MMNYFAPMDPTSAYLSSNWLFFLFPFLLLSSFYIKITRFYSFMSVLFNALKKETNSILQSIMTPSFTFPFLSLFLLIFLLNFMSLFPHIFTITSHSNFNFSLALTFWFTSILFAWIKNTNFMLAHLTPEGTPFPLIPFMILIEIISQIIRPLTLAVRLTTNMIAGHLMITLLTTLMSLLSSSTLTGTLIPLLILFILEASSALIQAYIFMILLTLYSKEMSH